MADFVAVLKKTLAGLGETTPEVREKVYQKARATVGAKLAALNPPPPAAVADRQRQALEDAIRQIESEYASVETPPPASEDPLAELDALFAGLSKPKVPASRPAASTSASSAAITASTQPEQAAAAPKVQPNALEGAELVPPEGVELPMADEPYGTDRIESSLPADPLDEGQEPAGEPLPEPERVPPPPRRERSGAVKWVVGAVAAVIVFGSAGYAMWLNQDSVVGLFRGGEQVADVQPPADAAESPAAVEQEAENVEQETETVELAAAPVTEETSPQVASESTELEKYTQRLNADGTEVDAGPAAEEATIGEGTSVAAATQVGQEAAANVLPGGDAEAAAGSGAVPVAQKAIFYEERTSVAQGSAEPGSVVWSIIQDSPGADLPPEPAIRAETTIPGKDIQLRMTIRRNVDDSLPASHIVELIFLTPDNFAGGTVDNVLRMTMKETEEAAGNPLLGIPAKIGDGFFLIALNDDASALEANRTLLRRQNWIDIPIVYKSGRRALVTMEKGIPGEQIFEEALDAWQEGSSG